jgi:hypothetical protein
MDSSAAELVKLVQELKLAIQNAQSRTTDLIVSRAELEIKTTTTIGPSGALKWGPVEIDGHYTESQIQTLCLALTPMPKPVRLMKPTADALADAIASISAAVHESVSTEPKFGLDEGTVSLNIVVEKGGKLSVVAGGGINSNNVHTLTLTLKAAA